MNFKGVPDRQYSSRLTRDDLFPHYGYALSDDLAIEKSHFIDMANYSMHSFRVGNILYNLVRTATEELMAVDLSGPQS